MSFWVNIESQSRMVPNEINGTFNPQYDTALMQANGWRVADEPPAPAEGHERLLGFAFVQDPDHEGRAIPQYVDTLIQDRLDKEAADAVAAAQRRREENFERYTYQNVYLLLCDNLTGNTDHAKLSFAQLTARGLLLRESDKPRYEKTRDALSLVHNALLWYDLLWWDTCVWTAEASDAALGLYTALMK